MRYRLHTLLIMLAAGASVVAFGIAMATAHALALEDALAERLDRSTVATVMDYLDDTWVSRSVGFTLIAGFWTVAGIALGWLIAPRQADTY